MDKQYLEEVAACGLHGEDICELCGRMGVHPACAARAVEIDRLFQESDNRLLEQYALHRRRGIAGHASQASFDQAVDALQGYLGRALECPTDQSIEGDAWWYIPECWIGIIGFVVDKRSFSIFPLGSGLHALSKLTNTPACWSGIFAFLGGHVEPVGGSDS